MDNASKALIIAGAVLIAVMLVSLGVLIYNQAIGIVNEQTEGMQGLSVSSFNNRFTQYYGSKKQSTVVKALIEEVNNANRISEDRNISIQASGIITGNNTGNYKYNTNAGKNATFTINATQWDTAGYVKQITITRQAT